MIGLYAFPTPNSIKVPITLEELGAAYTYHPVNIPRANKNCRLIRQTETGEIRMFEGLFLHAAGIGPAFGQSGYFQKLAPGKIPAAIARVHGEARRTLKILDGRLARAKYLAADEYSIADVANFGWIWGRAFAGVGFDEAPHVARWYEAIQARDAVTKAIAPLAA